MANEVVPQEDLAPAVTASGPPVPLSDLPNELAHKSLLAQAATEIARPFVTTAKEIGGGLKQALAPTYNTPNAFDELIGKILPGGAEASQKYISTPASQIAGAGRVLGAPVTGFMMEPAQRGVTGLLNALGAPESVSNMAGQTAAIGAGMLAPENLTNLVPNLVKSLGKIGSFGAAAPVNAVLQEQQANTMANVANREKFLQDTQAWSQQQQAAQQLGQRISAPGAGPLERVSPLAESVKPRLTPREAYSFLDNLRDPPVPYAYPNTMQTAQTISTEENAAFKAFQSPKMQSIVDELKAKNINTPVGMSAIPGFRENTELGAYYLQQIQDQLGTTKLSGTSLKEFSDIMSGVGQLTGASNPTLARDANRIYGSMKRDLAELGPTGDLLLKAQSIARQSNAASDVANKVFAFGSAYDATGNLKIAQSLDKLFAKDKYLRESFPVQDRQEIQDTLKQIFQGESVLKAKAPKPARTLPEEIAAPDRSSSIVEHHPFVVGGAAASLGFGPANVIAAGAVMLPKLLMKVLNTSPGRKFVASLYRDVPPKLSDVARIGALVNFFRASGDRDPSVDKYLQAQAMPTPPNQPNGMAPAEAGVPGGM